MFASKKHSYAHFFFATIFVSSTHRLRVCVGARMGKLNTQLNRTSEYNSRHCLHIPCANVMKY